MRSPLTLVKLGHAAWKLVRDPTRLGEVINLVDELQPTAFDESVEHVRRNPDRGHALVDKPRVHLDLAHLRSLPATTLGGAFARFIDQRNLDPGDLPTRPDHSERLWLKAHVLESHDIWHVVTGFDTDVAGEAGIQAFALAQFPTRLASILLAVVFVNMFLYSFDDRTRRMDAITRGWRLGRAAKMLIGFDWNAAWERPLDEVRAELGLDGAIEAQAA